MFNLPCSVLDIHYLRRPMTEKIIILDFGSQYTQLIARSVREANVYCEIIPFSKPVGYDPALKGIILSGSPFSVNDRNGPKVEVADLARNIPVLGICYGAQLAAKQYGGSVEKSSKREYGRAVLHQQKKDPLFADLTLSSQVWMSHGDTILKLPEGFEILATTDSIPVAAFKKADVSSQTSDLRPQTSDLSLPTSDFRLSSLRFTIPSGSISFH